MFKRFLFIVLIPSLGYAALSKTYPTSPVTTIRMDAYNDAFATIYKSTNAVVTSTWTVVNSSWTLIPSTQTVVFDTAVRASSTTWTIKRSTVTISEYTKMIVDETKLRLINEVLDKDVEQYMVWGGTVAPPGGWLGWCSEIKNGNIVPIVCK